MKACNNIVDKIITRLGKSNDSEITTAVLAGFKLIFIPIATMSDKKSSKDQKSYAIKRELLTETVALLGYLGITNVVKNNLTAPICKKYYKDKAKKLSKENKLDINSSDYKTLSNVDSSMLKANAQDVLNNTQSLSKSHQKSLNSLLNVVKKFDSILQKPDDLYINTKKTISHLCVCTLALSLIPFVTNKILEILSKANDENEAQKSNPYSKTNPKQAYSYLGNLDFNQYVQNAKSGGLNVFNR